MQIVIEKSEIESQVLTFFWESKVLGPIQNSRGLEKSQEWNDFTYVIENLEEMQWFESRSSKRKIKEWNV